MRILVTNVSNPKAKELIEQLTAQGHIVFALDSRTTDDRFRNFIKINMNNFEVLMLAIKIANPEEIHHFPDNSFLKSIHLLLAAHRIRKIFLYFGEPSNFLDQIADLCSKEFGFIYKSNKI